MQVVTDHNMVAVSFTEDEQRIEYFGHRSRQYMSPTPNLSAARIEIEAAAILSGLHSFVNMHFIVEFCNLSHSYKYCHLCHY